MPNVVRKDLDNSSAMLTVSVSREELKPKVDAELKKFRQRSNIKGFRQGQAPMDFVKRLYGSSIFGDTLNNLFSDELYNYLRESGLNILGQPLLSAEQTQFSAKIDSMDNEYAVNYDIGFVPEFTIAGLTKSESFDRLTIANIDDLANEELQNMRKQGGERSNPEDDIQDNDIVALQMSELDGDKVKEDGWQTTVSILVNRIPKEALRNAILKLKKGDTLRLNARELEESPKEDMYRKYILNLPENDNREVGDHFEAVIENVSRVAPAELNEEFLQKTFGPDVKSESEALEALKRDVARFYEMRANALVMRDIQKRLLELNHFDLPIAFLKRWLQSNNENLTPAQIEEEFEPFAENLRWSLLRDKLVAQFGINIDEEAVRNVFRTRVRSYFQVDLPDDLIDSTVARMMEKEEDVDKVRRDLEYDKLYDAVSSEVTLVDKPIASAEFHQIFDALQG
ncbi:MAG: hypothetical protein IT270_17520 [Saprospiraceae bacterium]|nr:hypothetical protein [Saprospiraceae bacterium]